MLHVTYGHAKISVNVNLLKSRAKSLVVWTLKAIRITAIISALLLFIGTAGSSDLDLISFKEIFYNIGICILLFGIAHALQFIKSIMK